jgi:hypothetical protein
MAAGAQCLFGLHVSALSPGLCLVDAPKAGEASLISRLGSLVVLLALAPLFSEQAAVPSLVASCKENARSSSSKCLEDDTKQESTYGLDSYGGFLMRKRVAEVL